MASPNTFHLDSEAMGTEIVTIYVGPKRKTFSVHKKLICDRSEVFSKAFKGQFREGEGTMYLQNEDIAAFDSFITYLYQDRLPNFNSNTNDAEESEEEKLYPLFCLAEKFCINELANRLMDTMQDLGLQNNTTPSNIDYLYQNTHEASKLRSYCTLMRLFLLHTSQDGDLGYETADIATDIPEFGSDIIKYQFMYRHRFQEGNVADAQVRDDEEGFGRCFFHTHAEGELCHLDNAVTGSK